jgi:hypothetical protein
MWVTVQLKASDHKDVIFMMEEMKSALPVMQNFHAMSNIQHVKAQPLYSILTCC